MKKIALIALLPFALAACNDAVEEQTLDETAAPVETMPVDTVSSDPVVTDPMVSDTADETMTGKAEPAETPEPVMTNAPG